MHITLIDNNYIFIYMYTILIHNISFSYYTISIRCRGLVFLCLTSLQLTPTLCLINSDDNYINNNNNKSKTLLDLDLRDYFGIQENFLFC